MIKKNIVTIGGGSGHSVLLSGLRDLENIDVCAVVAMSDSGRSNGKLREKLGILPVADILKCIIALSPKREEVKDFLLKKFEVESGLNGYNAGYMMMAKLALFDNFENAVKALSQSLEIKGKVLPVTLVRTSLATELENGELLFGEYTIDKPCGFYGENKKIARNFLAPHYGEKVKVYSPVIEAIKNADYIVIGPGGFYNSVMVNLLVRGVKKAILDSSAKIIFISNIFNHFGSEGFTLKNYMEVLEKRLERKIDIVIANDFNNIPNNVEKQFEKVDIDIEDGCEGKKIIIGDFMEKSMDGAFSHSSQKLADVVAKIINL